MNIEFMELLIRCVENYPCLWDTSSNSYNKREVAEKAWQDISENCGETIKFCKEKWKNVRTGFLRSLAKGKRFYLYDTMQFLLPIVSSSNNNSTMSFEPILPLPLQLQETYNPNENIYNNSGGVNHQHDSDTIIKIEDSLSNSDVVNVNESDTCENVTVEVTPKIGYFSQFATPPESTQNETETSFKPDYSDSKTSCSSLNNRKRRWNMNTSDEELNVESKEEKALMSFFKGITSDVLSLSIQKQRFFKRKIVELIDDLHEEDGQTIEKGEK